MEKKKLNELAEKLKLLMIQLDLFDKEYALEEIKELIDKMDENNSFLEAWPTPETMHKAEIMRSQTNTFRALYRLLETRKEQMRIQQSSNLTTGQEILKSLGIL